MNLDRFEEAAAGFRCGHELGLKEGATWNKAQSAQSLVGAVLAWVKQLLDDDDYEKAEVILAEHVKAFPDLTAFALKLREVRDDL